MDYLKLYKPKNEKWRKAYFKLHYYERYTYITTQINKTKKSLDLRYIYSHKIALPFPEICNMMNLNKLNAQLAFLPRTMAFDFYNK